MTISEVSEKYDISKDTLRYYEKAGMIPEIARLENGIRNYTESDCTWILQAKCMRNAGLSVKSITQYFKLYAAGDDTFAKRKDLLSKERDLLIEQKTAMEEMINKLDYKISKYDIALKTGVLSWDSEDC